MGTVCSPNLTSINERIKIQTRFFDALKRHVFCGVAVSYELAHSHLLPNAVELDAKQLTPYTFCCYYLLYNARLQVSKNYPGAKIAFFLRRPQRINRKPIIC